MTRSYSEGMQCVRYMLFTTNFMFLMIGFLLICIGSLIKLEYSDFEIFMEDHFFSPANLTMAIGCIIMFVALFGCMGAIKESTCLINLYALCLTMILILEVSAAIASFTMRSSIRGTVKEKMQESMQQYEHPDNYSRYAWDFLQDRLECCGVMSFKDWNHTNIMTYHDPVVICGELETTKETYCMPRSCLNGDYFRDGCLDKLAYWISDSACLLGIGASCVAFVQFMGIVFARILASTVRSLKTQRLVQRQQRREELYNAIHVSTTLGQQNEKSQVQEIPVEEATA